MSIEERKAAYEQSALKQLFDATDHEICPRCYCCSLMSESVPCPLCGGFCGAEWDEGDDQDCGDCFECGNEGEIHVKTCIGLCDENGNHASAGGR